MFYCIVLWLHKTSINNLRNENSFPSLLAHSSASLRGHWTNFYRGNSGLELQTFDVRVWKKATNTYWCGMHWQTVQSYESKQKWRKQQNLTNPMTPERKFPAARLKVKRAIWVTLPRLLSLSWTYPSTQPQYCHVMLRGPDADKRPCFWTDNWLKTNLFISIRSGWLSTSTMVAISNRLQLSLPPLKIGMHEIKFQNCTKTRSTQPTARK